VVVIGLVTLVSGKISPEEKPWMGMSINFCCFLHKVSHSLKRRRMPGAFLSTSCVEPLLLAYLSRDLGYRCHIFKQPVQSSWSGICQP
jgi:hypothetical protein